MLGFSHSTWSETNFMKKKRPTKNLLCKIHSTCKEMDVWLRKFHSHRPYPKQNLTPPPPPPNKKATKTKPPSPPKKDETHHYQNTNNLLLLMNIYFIQARKKERKKKRKVKRRISRKKTSQIDRQTKTKYHKHSISL